MNDPRGSIWRKWDLHIHTPASFHWNDGKIFRQMNEAEKEAALKKMVRRIQDSDVAVFGIMDYWTFDGYLEITRFLLEQENEIVADDPSFTFRKTILPGMELRIEAPTDFRLNIHVLLSDELSEQQLADFKSTLRIRSIDRRLSNEALIEFGRYLDDGKAKAHGFGPVDELSEHELWCLGCMTAEITRESLEQAIRHLPDGVGLVILPYDPSHGLEDLNWKNHPHADIFFSQLADIFESRSLKQIDSFVGKRTESNKHYIDDFLKSIGGPKPAISGSDAHRIDNYGKFPGGKITWIKADPTFDGLKQVISEPEGRSFVGELPEKLTRIRNNKTKYIRSVEIVEKPGADIGEAWFDNKIDLNPGLVAIIGNKGNGKSALTDIIALLGNSHRKEFSFLNEDKFRHRRDGKAHHFQATLTWESGEQCCRDLDASVASTEVEMVKYVPQRFFEDICNEIAAGRETEFDKELESVIFSHVPPAERLNYDSLDDLIHRKTQEVETRIKLLKTELANKNEDIVRYENQLSGENIETLRQKIQHKQTELEVHLEERPAEVDKPEGHSAADKEIENLRQRKADLQHEITVAQTKLHKYHKKLDAVEAILEKLETFQYKFKAFEDECEQELQHLSVTFDSLVKFEVDTTPLLTLRTKYCEQVDEIETSLDSENEGSLTNQIEKVTQQIEGLENQQEESERRYQHYLDALETWELKKLEIIGSEEQVGSLTYYENQMKEVRDTIPQQLVAAKERRMQIALDIYQEIQKLADIYRALYRPVQEFISSHELVKDEYDLKFEVSVVESDFAGRFLSHINQSVRGSFQGQEEGFEKVRGIVDKYDYDDHADVQHFLEDVMENLEWNTRANGGEKLDINRQLRKHVTVEDIYNFIFSLDYLRPDYQLKMLGQELPKLSPGERGVLLLLFYLLIDNNDYPLIIDQPDENLDSQSVYELLIPCITEARKKRQLIIVTHNPNLAITCDADQIIHASIDKRRGNAVTYTSGAIESLDLNRKAVDVLEGTPPAFKKRQAAYLDL